MDEDRRWVTLLGAEFAFVSVFLAAALGSGIGWFVLPVLLAAPIGGGLTLVYLAMSTDTNERQR
jgi:hypothetical protein